MRCLTFSAFAASTLAAVSAQSTLTPEHSNTCLRRSVIAYTSGTATYLYHGTTTLSATPSFCANVTTETLLSTIYGSNVTVTTTISQEPTSSLSATPGFVVAQSGFEPGSEQSYAGSASGPSVTAEIATEGPLYPFSGTNYLLITFNGTSITSRQQRRQASTPQSYNITQLFAATSGGTYTLSAYAAQAPNGNVDPDCTLTICAQGDCSAPSALTPSYSRYSYQWTSSTSESNAVALYSVQCFDSAYVALDDVAVVAGRDSPPSQLSTVTQYVTRTQTLQQTVTTSSISQGQPVTETKTATARELIAETKIFSFTTTEQTVSWVTATTIEQVPLVYTTTTTITRTLNGSTIPAVTATATTTQWVTATTLSGYPILQNASTTTVLSTQLLTTTLPVTLPPETYTPLPETQIVTFTPYPLNYTTNVTYTLPQSTATQIVTFTPYPLNHTMNVTYTLPQPTTTQIVTFTPYPLNHTMNVTYTLPQPTTTQLETFTEPVFGTITETTIGEPSQPPQQTIIIPSGVPAVALASPTAIIGDINGSPGSYDDYSYPVTLPFALTLFNQPSTQVHVTTNGVVGWNTGNGAYTNTVLPAAAFDTAALALWDDLFVYAGTQQGIYYQVDGVAPRRSVTFEFYLSHYASQTEYYHFLISFSEAFPNSVSYQYLNVSDRGGSATVGVQSMTAGNRAGQYSFNQAIIYPGMQMTWYTTATTASYYISNPGSATARMVSDFAGRTWDEAIGRTKTRMNQWLEAGSRMLKW